MPSYSANGSVVGSVAKTQWVLDEGRNDLCGYGSS